MRCLKPIILLLTIILFIGGCTPIQKSVGSPCESYSECKNYKCVEGKCVVSELNEYCLDSSVCEGELICKESKCQKAPALCAFGEYASIFKIVAYIMLALLILGSIIPLPTAAFGASITHGGIKVVGYILIMAISWAIGYFLTNNCF